MNDPLTPVEQARPGVDHFQFKPNIAVTAPAIAKSSVLADESGKRKSFVGTVRPASTCRLGLIISQAGWHQKSFCSRGTMGEQISGVWASQ